MKYNLCNIKYIYKLAGNDTPLKDNYESASVSQ